MTCAFVNLGLAPDAEARLEEYLGQMRAALAGTPDVSPDEIEADICEHVENELQSAARPVSLSALEAILSRLGPPTQWLPSAKATPRSELLSPWKYASEQLRRIKTVLWRGPEDWRLAYLSFGMFALGIFIPPLLLASYFLSRAGVSLIRQKEGNVDVARMWLLYPPLVLFSLAFVLVLILIPPIGATCGAFKAVLEADRQERWEAGEPRGLPYPKHHNLTDKALKNRFPDVETTLDKLLARLPRVAVEPLAVLFLFAGCASCWGTVAGLLGSRFPAAVRALFFPLANGFGGKWAGRVGFACLTIFIVWCAIAYRIVIDVRSDERAIVGNTFPAERGHVL